MAYRSLTYVVMCHIIVIIVGVPRPIEEDQDGQVMTYFCAGKFCIAWTIPHRLSEAYSANSIAKLNYRYHMYFSDWSKLAQNLGVG